MSKIIKPPLSNVILILSLAFILSAVPVHATHTEPNYLEISRWSGMESDFLSAYATFKSIYKSRGVSDTKTYLPIISHCLLLYFDDFSDPTSGWPITNDFKLLEYLDGEYRMAVFSDDRFGDSLAIYPGDAISDYLVTVEARPAVSGGTYGIYFGSYYFMILGSGYSIRYGDYNQGWTTLVSGTSSALTLGPTIAIERSGDMINAYANGYRIASVMDNTFPEPDSIGLAIQSFGYTHHDVRFDNFKVESAGCGWSSLP